MSNPLTTVIDIVSVAPLHELFNIAHSRPFSLLFGNYSWMLGEAGGLTLIWAIYAIYGRRRGVEYRFALPLAVAFIIGGFLSVLSEMHQPSRMIYGYLSGWEYWDTSIIKTGIILLPLYLIMCWWLVFQAIDRQALAASIERLHPGLRGVADLFSLWSRHYSVLDTTWLRRIVLGVVIALSLFAPMYSGIFLMNEHGVAIWNSPAQMLLFMATAVAKGALLMVVVIPVLARLVTGHKVTVALTPQLRLTAVIAIFAYVIIWFDWLWWKGSFGTLEDLRAAHLYMGPYARTVFFQWIVPGMIVPLIVLLTPLSRQRWAQWLALLGVLWGSYAIRMLILMGGEALNRSGAGYQAYTISNEVLRYTAFSVFAIIGVLAVLLLALPVNGAPELNEPVR